MNKLVRGYWRTLIPFIALLVRQPSSFSHPSDRTSG
jgi:hypothetical protein